MLKICSRSKRLTLTGLLLFLIAGFSVHQVQAQNISYGLKGGINLANHYNAQFDTDPITTIGIGAYASVQLGSSPFAIQPEFNYFQYGSESAFQSGDIAFRGTFRTDYIKVPILFHYVLEFSREFQVGLLAGPSISFLVQSKFSDSSLDLDLMEITNNTDYGVVGGVVFKSPALSDRLSLELRLSRGFSEIYSSGFNPEGGGEFSRPNKNTAHSILLGFEF